MATKVERIYEFSEDELFIDEDYDLRSPPMIQRQDRIYIKTPAAIGKLYNILIFTSRLLAVLYHA